MHVCCGHSLAWVHCGLILTPLRVCSHLELSLLWIRASTWEGNELCLHALAFYMSAFCVFLHRKADPELGCTFLAVGLRTEDLKSWLGKLLSVPLVFPSHRSATAQGGSRASSRRPTPSPQSHQPRMGCAEARPCSCVMRCPSAPAGKNLQPPAESNINTPDRFPWTNINLRSQPSHADLLPMWKWPIKMMFNHCLSPAVWHVYNSLWPSCCDHQLGLVHSPLLEPRGEEEKCWHCPHGWDLLQRANSLGASLILHCNWPLGSHPCHRFPFSAVSNTFLPKAGSTPGSTGSWDCTETLLQICSPFFVSNTKAIFPFTGILGFLPSYEFGVTLWLCHFPVHSLVSPC